MWGELSLVCQLLSAGWVSPDVLCAVQCTGLAALVAVGRLGLPQLSSTRNAVNLTHFIRIAWRVYAVCADAGCPSARFSVICVCVSADEAVLRDLKHLLLEAKQKVPEFLLQVESDWDFISRGGEDG